MKHLPRMLFLIFFFSLLNTLVYASKGKEANGMMAKRLALEGPDAKTTTQLHPDEVQAFRETGSPAAELEKERGRTKGKFSLPPPLTRSKVPAKILSLSGDYTVGAGQTFFTLHEVVSVLNNATLTGPTRFLLTDALYTETSGLSLGAVNGSSSTNTITFQPASTISGVTITITNNDTYGGGWVFTAISHLTINGTKDGGAPGSRDLTIQFDPSQSFPLSSNAPLRFYDGCSDINLLNTIVKGQVNLTGGTGAITLWQTSLSATPLSKFLIDNCEVTQASRAIAVYGWIGAGYDESGNNSNISVTNNLIHDVHEYGIYLLGVSDGNIKGNIINNVTTAAAMDDARTSGMYLISVYRLNIENNAISNIINLKTGTSSGNRVYGIRLLGAAGLGNVYDPEDAYVTAWSGYPTKNRIMQNTIATIESESNTHIAMVGFSTEGTRHDTAAHNSINMAGADKDGGVVAIYTYGTSLATSRLRCYNNIAVVTRATTNPANLNAVIRSSDLAGFDYRAPSDNNVYYNSTPGGVLFADAGYPSTYEICNARGVDCYSVNGDPRFISATDLHIDNSAYTPATNVGKPYPQVPVDFDGAVRSSTTPDAGAYEFSDSPTGTDVEAISILLNNVIDFPVGIPYTGFRGKIRNTNQFPIYGASATLRIVNPSNVEVFTETVSGINLNAFSGIEITFTGTFTPAVTGIHTMELIASATGDINGSNDTVSKSIPVVGQATIPYATDFNNAGDADGWIGTGDFVLDNTFTKLGGPRGGSGNAWVTVPGPPGTHYNPGKINFLYSPYFDFSPVTNGYISFFHSIKTEPAWDRSRMEYSIDTGKTWQPLGTLDEPDGINWYHQALYHNANPDLTWGCFDDFICINYNCPFVGWTSNGNCYDGIPTGPYGYVYVQLHLPADMYGKNFVRFRYLAYSDAAATFDGWAIDDFTLSPNICCAFTSSVSGNVFHDIDGDGLFNNADSTLSGVVVNLKYFDNDADIVSTDGNGDYHFTGLNPGNYSVAISNDTLALTLPVSGTHAFESDGASTDNNLNFGIFLGSVSGKVVNDDNRNGSDDGENGYGGFVIEAHTDSCSGPVVYRGSVQSNNSGMYKIPLPPGTYYVSITQPSGYETIGAPCQTVTISGTSGSSSANVADVNFYIFKLGIVEYEAINNFDCDICIDYSLPAGVFVNFEVYKEGVRIDSSTIGNASTVSKTYADFGVGEYVFKQLNIPDGWIVTNGIEPDTIVISSSGQNFLITQLHFKKPKVSGYVFHDIDGDGTNDAGEQPLQGWTVNISGNGGGTFLTDSNGFYETYVENGSHTISEVLQSGWSQTMPPDSGVYTFVAVSGTVPGADKTNKNFGNFRKYSISGAVYRDYNADGTRDFYDSPLDGITISLNGTGGGTVLSSNGGLFRFDSVGHGTRTLSIVPPVGFSVVIPSEGSYSIIPTSGQDVTDKVFGLFLACDGCVASYRTFTKDSLEAWAFLKPLKRGKGFPNIQNMYDEMISKAKAETTVLGVLVGKSGEFLPSMKMKGYVQPSKTIDLNTTFAKKGKTGILYHTGTPRGLDFYIGSEKRVLKLNKNLGADKHDNTLLANLLTLSVNSRASYFGKTPEGFGDLIYIGSVESWRNLTVDEILETAREMMTNWEFTSNNMFAELNSAVEEMNEAFSGPLDTSSFIMGKSLSWTGVRDVVNSGVFIANSSPKPRTKLPYIETVEPEEFVLAQNYPNPFNPVTTLQFDLNEPAVVTLRVYNMLGQEVATLIEQEEYSDGRWEVHFDADGLTSGVYFYRISIDVTDAETGTVSHAIQTKKMLLAR